VLHAAARRLALLLGGLTAGIALAAVAFGLLLDTSLPRAISLGYYAIGAFLLVVGFALGNRGPVRTDEESLVGIRRPRRLRTATAQEQQDSIATSALFVFVGVTLVLIGVAVDSRIDLL
jgi:uncharacterized membrane protein YidH (DUF202 family)